MQVKSNRIADIRNYYGSFLDSGVISGESQFLVDSVIAHFADIPRLQLSLNGDKRVSESLLLKIHFAVKALKQQKPLQYALGETEFQGMRFKVNESVLIPRPETEELVELIVKEMQDVKGLHILDIGTGSGCIAVSLSKLLDANVYAVDVSENALEVASGNANLNNVEVDFMLIDILSENAKASLPKNLDIIVSNPPYVREMEKKMMQSNVLDYEPDLALFVEDDDPLIFYKTITEIASLSLSKNGQLWFEINEYLARETLQLVEKHFDKVILINDYKGAPRFIMASNA